VPNAILEQTRRVGFVGRKTIGPVAMYTHPQTAKLLGPLIPSARKNNLSLGDLMKAPMVCGCVQIWANTESAISNLFMPWKICAGQEQCILPKGADGFKRNGQYVKGHECKPGLLGKCHRGDQSALSIVLYEAFQVRTNKTAGYISDVLTKHIDTVRGGGSRSEPSRPPNCTSYKV